MEIEKTRCLIVGSGPAGYTAAIYSSRAGLQPILYEGTMPGGQLTTTTEIENFPGYPDGISGYDMMEDMKRQSQRFGTDVRLGHITSVDLSKRPFTAVVDNVKEIEADTIIIATGATAKYLGLPSEQRYMSSGVSACATCDGFFHRGKDVVVVGGGDTACEEALFLSTLCNKVWVVVRKDYMRASEVMKSHVEKRKNIEVLYETNTKEVLGDGQVVTGVRLVNNDGTEREIPISGFFLGIGHHPNTELFKEWLDIDDQGYLVTVKGSSITNIPGVFAAGDVQDSVYRQAVTAAGSGAKAAIDCERFLLDEA